MTDNEGGEPPKPKKPGTFLKGHDPRRAKGGAGNGPDHSGSFKKGYDPRRDDNRKPAIRNHNGIKITDLARSYTEEALNFLVETMRDDSVDRRSRLMATNQILNRGWGLCERSISITADVEHKHTATIDPSRLSVEAKRQLLAAMLAPEQTITAKTIEAKLIEPSERPDE